ncbi:hypothetical protein BU17DRAFT_102625 [Hysterangium stoloniferum]|nr:hypothetical protein BU17DRAFT_102625 [Hysterangium stoloniferum]
MKAILELRQCRASVLAPTWRKEIESPPPRSQGCSRQPFYTFKIHLPFQKDTSHNLYFKYLPHTILASDPVFYTSIFSIEFWKQQPQDMKFINVLQTKAAESKMGRGVSLLLEFCGRVMDGIEEELRSNSKSRSQVGLGSYKGHTSLPKGNPTNWLFLMLLTDRILWAHSQGPLELSIPPTFKLHQHPHSNKYDRNGVGGMPVSKSMRELYLGYDDAAAKALLGRFFSSISQSDSLPPNRDLDLSKGLTLTENISNTSHSPPSEEGVYKLHGNLIKHSIRLGAHAHLTRSLANVFWLASSAKFLLMSFDSKYVQNLKEWWSELNEPTGVNDWFKALLESEPSFKHEVRKFPICMALAHNPMFVLDERCRLEHWQRPNHGFGMSKFAAQALSTPQTRSYLTLCAERCIWAFVSDILGHLQAPYFRVDENTICTLPALGVTSMFAHQIRNATSADNFPVHFTREPWPYEQQLRSKVQHGSHQAITTSEPRQQRAATLPLSTLLVSSVPQRLPFPLEASPNQPVPPLQNPPLPSTPSSHHPQLMSLPHSPLPTMLPLSTLPVSSTPHGLLFPLEASPHQTIPPLQHPSLPDTPSSNHPPLASPPPHQPPPSHSSSPLPATSLPPLHISSALFSNLDKESESYHPLALSTDNLGEEGDNNIGESNNNDREGENNLKDAILSTAQEDQHQGKQSGAGLPSTMPNVESGDAQEEQLLPEQFPGPDGDLQLLESHLGKRKWDSDPESELTALPDDDQSPEPCNSQVPPMGDSPEAVGGLLPRPKVHPWKHFHPHTSYSVQKRVRLNWEPCSDVVELSQIKSPVQMKSGQKHAVESYVFKTFVNDGNDVYQVIDAEYELEWFKGLEKDREIFQDLCNIAQPPHLYNPCTMSDSIPADCTCFPASWFKDVLSDEEELTPLSLKKLSLFCDRVIMIPNPDRRRDFFQDRVHKSFDIQQLALQQGVDIHMQREVHALDRRNEMDCQFQIYQTSLLKVFEEKRKAVNFLDIPTAVSMHMPNILPMISYDSLAGNHTMNGAMGFPQYAIRWRLCATEGAFSRAHIDAGKFATWIRIVHGTKLWVVMSGDIAETSLRNLNYRKRKWTYYLLEPGDQLFMPAGTIHAVMTLNDSWVEGGHFYGRNSLHLSFLAGLREHRQGLTDCNKEHPHSEYILHALLKTYYGIFLSYFPHQKTGDVCSRNSDPVAYETVLHNWPPLEQLAYLLVLTGHPHHFEPEAKEGDPYQCSSTLIPTRKVSLKRIFHILNFCPEIQQDVRRIENEMAQYLDLRGEETLDSLCDAEGVQIAPDRMEVGASLSRSDEAQLPPLELTLP